jgi:hypothetical protein
MIMRGQGKHTKFAAAATTTTISGFALWTSVVYGIQQERPAFSRSALLVVVILFGISTIWPVMLSSRRVLRRWVDPKWSKRRATESGEHGHVSAPSRRKTAPTAHLEAVAESSTEGPGWPSIPSRPAREPSVSVVT